MMVTGRPYISAFSVHPHSKHTVLSSVSSRMDDKQFGQSIQPFLDFGNFPFRTDAFFGAGGSDLDAGAARPRTGTTAGARRIGKLRVT